MSAFQTTARFVVRQIFCLVPIISRTFPVRDAQIRLMLLRFFPNFVSLMDIDYLQTQLLP